MVTKKINLSSRFTVKFHVSNILSKPRAESHTEAVALAIQNHLV